MYYNSQPALSVFDRWRNFRQQHTPPVAKQECSRPLRDESSISVNITPLEHVQVQLHVEHIAKPLFLAALLRMLDAVHVPLHHSVECVSSVPGDVEVTLCEYPHQRRYSSVHDRCDTARGGSLCERVLAASSAKTSRKSRDLWRWPRHLSTYHSRDTIQIPL